MPGWPGEGTGIFTAQRLKDRAGDYLRLVQPPVLSLLIVPNGDVTLTWNSFTNGTYRVEYKTTLTATSWTAITPDVSATGTTSCKGTMLLRARSVTTGGLIAVKSCSKPNMKTQFLPGPKRRAADRPAKVLEQAVFTPPLPLLTGNLRVRW